MPDACGLVRLLTLAQAAPTDYSSLPPELALEIFRYATYVPRIRGLSPGDPFEPQRPSNFAWGINTPVSSLATKRTLVLVCRAWHCLATELLYEHVVISSMRRALLLYRTLRDTSRTAQRLGMQSNTPFEHPDGLARWIRHVEVHDCSRTSKSIHFWAALASILSILPGLRVLSGIWERPLPDNILQMFTRYLSSSISSLYWDESSVYQGRRSLLSTSFLAKYQSLRVLDIRKLRFDDPDSFPAGTGPSISLPSVVDLLLPVCPAVLGFARKLGLPRLRRLILDAADARRSSASYVVVSLNALLEAHGEKLTTVELLPVASLAYKSSPVSIASFLQPGICPALDTFVFDCREKVLSAGPPPLPCLPSSPARPSAGAGAPLPPAPPTPSRSAPEPELRQPHPALRRIGIRGMSISRLYPNHPTHAQDHLRAFLAHRALFPALETVRTLGMLVDACADTYARDIFIWWTEKFEELGVDLQDGEGVVFVYTDPVDGKAAAGTEGRQGAKKDANPAVEDGASG